MYLKPKEKLMESVDRELSKSIQRHLDSGKIDSLIIKKKGFFLAYILTLAVYCL